MPPPRPALVPKTYAVVSCTPKCSVGRELLGEEASKKLHAIFESGQTLHYAQAQLRKLSIEASISALHRHRNNHLREIKEKDQPGEDPGTAVPTLELLDSIIVAGFRNRHQWKPTIQDTMKAMEMKLKVTGASAFDDFFAAIDAASGMGDDDGEEGEQEEALEALLSADERPDEDSPDLQEL